MINGSCCCGAVKFTLLEKPNMMGTCHCSRCRKVGASTIIFVEADTFKLTKGLEFITTYKAIPPYKYDRCFCSVCGTALGEILSTESSFPISANCLDDKIDLENSGHEFVSEKPAWLHIGDSAKQNQGHPS